MQGKVFWCTPPINYSTFVILNRQFKKSLQKGQQHLLLYFMQSHQKVNGQK